MTLAISKPKLTRQREMITEGCNIQGMWSLADELVDLDKLYTSDIYAILQTYGVEACRTAIINEMAAVFGVYGIKVDYRHRTVIADYMVSLYYTIPNLG